MLKVIQNKSILDYDIKENSIIIVDKNIYKYKTIYIRKNVLVTNKLSFMQKYNDKKLLSENINFILMSKAYFSVKDNLKIYKDVNNLSFINNLILTYSFYMENKMKENDKYHDLKLIYNEYEKLVCENNFLTQYDLYNIEINKINYDYIYFENINNLNEYDINLINKLKNKKEVILFANTLNNNSLINDLNKICNVEYEKINNYDINKLFEISSSNLFKNIKLISCNDLYEEIKYICLDIKKKINKGLKYKEILIVSSDVERYKNYFKLIFDFPYKKEEKIGYLTKNLICNLKDIFESDFSSINFINLLKLDLLDIKKDDIYLLDNYIYMWNLENEKFYNEFIYNPSGKRKLYENDIKILNKINELKMEIINPFKYLLENIKGIYNKKEILKYLYMFLDESGIASKLSEKDYDGYNKLISILEDLYDYLPDEVTLFEIFDYLINMFKINNKSINMQDEVNICALKDYDKNDYKMVYFIGVTEKDIPLKFTFSTLINNNDLEDDIIYNLINKTKDLNNNLISNILLNENISITYHKLNDNNGKLERSPILNKFKNKEENFKYIINNKVDINLNKKIEKNLALKLYGSVLNLSPSSLEMFAKCKYSYFLNYGLKIKIKEKLLFDNKEIGTFIHYVLENALKDKISYDDIKTSVDLYVNNYLKENNYITSSVLKYVIKELKESVIILLEIIFDELNNTILKPEKEELNLKDNPLIIKLNTGILNVSGIVDRLDSYIENDNYYFRIIDYKTGSKKFRLDDVLIGLNMQMLIYLTLIKENKKGKNSIPTGFLYFPAMVHYNYEKRNISKVEALNNIKSNIKMNGILNSDFIKLYNEEKVGNYIDVISRGKLNEEKVFSNYDIDNILKLVKKNLKDEGNSILNGDISINPVIDSKNDSCKYCLFNGICKFNKLVNKPRRYKNLKNKEALIKIEESLKR